MNGLDVKIARLRAGVKQYELAALIGIPQSTLCKIEREKKSLQPRLLGRILESLSARDHEYSKHR